MLLTLGGVLGACAPATQASGDGGGNGSDAAGDAVGDAAGDAGAIRSDAGSAQRDPCPGLCFYSPLNYPAHCPNGFRWDGVSAYSSSCTSESGPGICCIPDPTSDNGVPCGGACSVQPWPARVEYPGTAPPIACPDGTVNDGTPAYASSCTNGDHVGVCCVAADDAGVDGG